MRRLQMSGQARDTRGIVPRSVSVPRSLWITHDAIYQELFILLPDFSDGGARPHRGTVPRPALRHEKWSNRHKKMGGERKDAA